MTQLYPEKAHFRPIWSCFWLNYALIMQWTPWSCSTQAEIHLSTSQFVKSDSEYTSDGIWHDYNPVKVNFRSIWSYFGHNCALIMRLTPWLCSTQAQIHLSTFKLLKSDSKYASNGIWHDYILKMSILGHYCFFDQNVKNSLKDAEFAGNDMNCQKKCKHNWNIQSFTFLLIYDRWQNF